MRPHEICYHHEFFKQELLIPDTRESCIVNVSPSFSVARAAITQVFPLVVECSLKSIPPCARLIWNGKKFHSNSTGALWAFDRGCLFTDSISFNLIAEKSLTGNWNSTRPSCAGSLPVQHLVVLVSLHLGVVTAGDIVLSSWARHFTLTVPLSTQVYNWVPANLILGVTLRWTSIPSRGE